VTHVLARGEPVEPRGDGSSFDELRTSGEPWLSCGTGYRHRTIVLANRHSCTRRINLLRLADGNERIAAFMNFAQYDTGGFIDEMFVDNARPRAAARALSRFINNLPPGELQRRQQSAERALLHMGITFNVYGDSAGTERIFPFDLVPRIVAAAEWDLI